VCKRARVGNVPLLTLHLTQLLLQGMDQRQRQRSVCEVYVARMHACMMLQNSSRCLQQCLHSSHQPPQYSNRIHVPIHKNTKAKSRAHRCGVRPAAPYHVLPDVACNGVHTSTTPLNCTHTQSRHHTKPKLNSCSPLRCASCCGESRAARCCAAPHDVNNTPATIPLNCTLTITVGLKEDTYSHYTQSCSPLRCASCCGE
jgi:hypothetical protein